MKDHVAARDLIKNAEPAEVDDLLNVRFAAQLLDQPRRAAAGRPVAADDQREQAVIAQQFQRAIGEVVPEIHSRPTPPTAQFGLGIFVQQSLCAPFSTIGWIAQHEVIRPDRRIERRAGQGVALAKRFEEDVGFAWREWSGRLVGRGIYYCRLATDEYRIARKLVKTE